ncbi:MAG: spermine synthase [Sphaerospermopsis sp.]|uniref:spermine/spermidine synthase domain-containing protein n=1 Tax=unclassified Sphaerospermopsis TaxID=2646443 RepID=UPI0016807378|nr:MULTISPECIES: spermine synthase [unclassified Sphaerospermopsis]MBD2131775.1 spermine synthase [Sphaerospermopsis sp. FACHB-1094]MBD2145967.1 spermine synthase [Sphaerospermopsis sp. FACHB-1194]MEB3148337.1 spermine synthase [Sphaerospermopsis sp.]
MSISLFIENYDHRIAFYINGDLQFDSADEAIYHENLVIPAVSLAIQRFTDTDLRVLICGGGDGLAARDLLRFAQVKNIDLVDYNPDVIELANTVFKPYNLGSLEHEKVTVYTQEAFGFVRQLVDDYYHVVICDFTCPKSAEDAKIYSQEWFQEVNRILIPSGIVAVNGVSPNYDTHAFWCLYQTLLSVNFATKPLQIQIPSFCNHDYGDWGFFLGSTQRILRTEIENIDFPNNLNYLTRENLLPVFKFEQKIAAYRHKVTIHTLENERLFYYLLNHPSNPEDILLNSGEYVDFLDINEQFNAEIENINSLDLESVAKFWLQNIYAAPNADKDLPNINQFVPVRHPYHEPKMTTYWLDNLQGLLSEIDVNKLLNSLLTRVQELPPQIASELRTFADKIKYNQPLGTLNPKMVELITLLSITLLMTNLVAPDSVFAKGSYYGSRSSSSSYNDGTGDSKWVGFIFTCFSSYWIYSIIKRMRNN